MFAYRSAQNHNIDLDYHFQTHQTLLSTLLNFTSFRCVVSTSMIGFCSSIGISSRDSSTPSEITCWLDKSEISYNNRVKSAYSKNERDHLNGQTFLFAMADEFFIVIVNVNIILNDRMAQICTIGGRGGGCIGCGIWSNNWTRSGDHLRSSIEAGRINWLNFIRLLFDFIWNLRCFDAGWFVVRYFIGCTFYNSICTGNRMLWLGSSPTSLLL